MSVFSLYLITGLVQIISNQLLLFSHLIQENAIFNFLKRKDSEKKIFEITPVLRLFISKGALFKKIRLKKIPLEIVYVRKINGYRIYVDIMTFEKLSTL